MLNWRKLCDFMKIFLNGIIRACYNHGNIKVTESWISGLLSSEKDKNLQPILITRMRIYYQKNGFPGHPAYRQKSLALDWVIVAWMKCSTHAEIWYLDCVEVANQTISGGQVTVDDVQSFQVLHARRYLGCHVDQTTVAAQKQLHHFNY